MELTATATTLAAMLDAVDAALPTSLLPPGGTALLRAVAARVPFVPAAGFECHLGDVPRRGDLSTGEPTAHGALAATISRLTNGRIPPESLAAGGEVERRIDTVLLEFDVPPDGAAHDPAVFLALRPHAAAEDGVLLELGAALAGELHPRTAALLRRCADAIGDDVQISHLGAMCGRADCPLRLNVATASAAALRRYAAAIGMTADRRAALDGVLEVLEPHAHHLVLTVDLAHEPLPRFGVECYMRAAEDVDGWRALFAHLTALRLCTAAEARAALSWPGRTASERATLPGRAAECAIPSGRTAPERTTWPSERRYLAQFVGSGAAEIVLRAINHVKLVAAPGEPLRAKVYLVARAMLASSAP